MAGLRALAKKKHYDHKQEVKHENDVKSVLAGCWLQHEPVVMRTQKKNAQHSRDEANHRYKRSVEHVNFIKYLR